MDTALNPNSAPEAGSPLSARCFKVRDLGLTEYAAAYRHQLELVADKKHGRFADDTLLLVEHLDVYTYGRKSKMPLLPSDVPSFAVERGGEITYHNPGQLVCYPILSLSPPERDLHRHLRRLESTLIAVLGDFGIAGERRVGATGVWIVGKQKKIASIGVAVSSWVTYHGSALNVCNDLSGFLRVNPCGFSGEVMTSMQAELGDHCPSMEAVKGAFIRHFCGHFDRAIGQSWI